MKFAFDSVRRFGFAGICIALVLGALSLPATAITFSATTNPNNPPATTIITITQQGLSPEKVTIHPADTVTWQNASGTSQTLALVPPNGSRINMPLVARSRGAAPSSKHDGLIVRELGVGEAFSQVFIAPGLHRFSVGNFTGEIDVVPDVPGQTPIPPTAPAAETPTTPAGAAIILAAGDIASCASGLAGAQATASLIKQVPGAQVLALGDLAYGAGTDAQFQNCYHPTWGAFVNRTHPAPGNHEYLTAGAAGYYRYFNVPEYYAWSFGGWHFISLNSEIDYSTTSLQMTWLRADLAANRARCTLAYWHRPRFSSGSHHGSDASLAGLWGALQAGGVSVVLNGHEHHYERFEAQDMNGNADAAGMREFVVGTGGASFYGFAASPKPNSQFRLSNAFGVLRMDLLADSYRWQFIDINGAIRDSGTAKCNASA